MKTQLRFRPVGLPHFSERPGRLSGKAQRESISATVARSHPCSSAFIRGSQMSPGISGLISHETSRKTSVMFSRVPNSDLILAHGEEPGALRTREVDVITEEFLEGRGKGGNGEKLGEGISEGEGRDEFGGEQAGTDGAEPGSEGSPDEAQ